MRRVSQRGHNEADRREQLAEVMLDLHDHAPGAIPRDGLIVEAPVAHQRGATRPAPRPGEEILDGPLQDLVLAGVTRL